MLDNKLKNISSKDLYDVLEYSYLSRLFNMRDKFCAAIAKDYSLYVVDLKTRVKKLISKWI